MTKQQKRAKAFHYSREGDDPITKLRSKKSAAKPSQQNKESKVQPPWFNEEVKELWRKKIAACNQAQRNKGDENLREVAKQASAEFEKAARHEKERIYEDFSRTVSEDRSLHKFWQLHRAMNCSKKVKDIPDFRTEDDVWVRTPEEKGTALFDRFLRQTGREMSLRGKPFLTAWSNYMKKTCRSYTHSSKQTSFSESSPKPQSQPQDQMLSATPI